MENGTGSEVFGGMWVVVLGNGYQGAQELLSAGIPKKKPVRAELCQDDERWSRKTASDGIIVENEVQRQARARSLLTVYGRIRCTRRRLCLRVESAHEYCSITTDASISW